MSNIGTAISSRTYKTKGSRALAKPFGTALGPFLYVFAKLPNAINSNTAARINPNTFFVIQKSQGFALSLDNASGHK